MCLIGLHLDAASPWPIVIAANRDEAHARPAAAAHWWPSAIAPTPADRPDRRLPAILAGRDQLAGGTWLGLALGPAAAQRDPAPTGSLQRLRIGALTNIRPGLMPARLSMPASWRSRGELVTRWLTAATGTSPGAWLDTLAGEADDYPGFNLLALDAHWDSRGLRSLQAGACGNDRATTAIALPAGITLISNGGLGTRWPKSQRLGQAMTAAITGTGAPASAGPATTRPDDAIARKLLQALSDRAIPAAGEQPPTGLPPERERLLSSVFIVDPDYGTRASTVVVVDARGNGLFTEHGFGPDGQLRSVVVERFSLHAAAASAAA